MLGQRIDLHAQPLGRDRPQTAVEVGACTIQIDTEDECTFGHVRSITGCGLKHFSAIVFLDPVNNAASH